MIASDLRRSDTMRIKRSCCMHGVDAVPGRFALNLSRLLLLGHADPSLGYCDSRVLLEKIPKY